MTRQRPKENAADYVVRLEDEIDMAAAKIERLERQAERAQDEQKLFKIRLEQDAALAERERDFLREQLTELSLQILSTSAPRTRQQMRRLLDGMLRGEDWRNGTWIR